MLELKPAHCPTGNTVREKREGEERQNNTEEEEAQHVPKVPAQGDEKPGVHVHRSPVSFTILSITHTVTKQSAPSTSVVLQVSKR